jgi:hypothetical protein
MLEKAVRKAEGGIEVDGGRIFARNINCCRLRGTLAFDIYLQDGIQEEPMLCMAAFPGIEPHYRPWMEIFCIRGSSRCGKDYFGSAMEDSLLEFFSQSIGPGGKIYIEYYCDRETSYGLAMGFPPAVTRQGYKLFKLGFTWFKDWYFSQGGHEGGQKLQGEKPLNEAARRKHLQRIKTDIEAFLMRPTDPDAVAEGEEREYFLRARERAKELIAGIDNYLAGQG